MLELNEIVNAGENIGICSSRTTICASKTEYDRVKENERNGVWDQKMLTMKFK